MSAAMNPVTPQASVVRNANYDRYFSIYRQKNTNGTAIYRGTESHNFSMMPHELAFALKSTQNTALSRPHSSGANDAELKVFSSLNNFPILTNQESQALLAYNDPATIPEQRAIEASKLKNFIRKKLNFVGVPLIPIDARNSNAKDTVSIAISGSQTIDNTSKYNIHVGDKIVWDVPDSFSGTPSESKPQLQNKTKHVFLTVPYEHAVSDTSGGYVTDLINAIQSNSFPDDQNVQMVRTQYVEMVNEILARVPAGSTADQITASIGPAALGYTQAMRHTIDEVNDRVIGVALSSARPGEAFDIFLKANR